MNVTYLNSHEMKKFQNIHKLYLPKRKRAFGKNGVSSKSSNIENKTNIDYIIEKARFVLDLFEKKDYDSSKYYVEFQHRNCGFEKKCRRTFNWHNDNYNFGGYPVFTVIFYIRKDLGIKGGGLEYIIDSTKNIHSINEGNILCFDGRITHRPEICSGIGCRDSIVVFIKKKHKT